jgi:H+/gluconate symporter-like permease
MPFFKTTVYAAPVLGIVAALFMAVAGVLWLQSRAKRAMNNGEGYGDHPQENIKHFDGSKLPSLWLALIPILLVLIINFGLTTWVITANAPGYEYLKDAPYSTNLGAVRGIWTLVISLIIGILFTIAANWKRFGKVLDSVNGGAMGSMLPILNTASEVGYGNVVKTLSAFAIVQAALLAISDNPLITSAIATNVLAGITGSASGGMSIALGAMGETFYQQALAKGINPEVLHRVVAIACGGLDSLPHNGAVITLLGITQLNHRQSYVDVGMVSVVIPVLSCVIAIILGSLGVV